MNFSVPVLIADEHEEIRAHLREILSKHGFFHLVEAQSAAAVLNNLTDEHFLIIHSKMLNRDILKRMKDKKKFIIISQNDAPETVELAAHYGVNNLVSFPYSAQSLKEKIDGLMEMKKN
jgi:DNA-binding NtrC family response regulator